MIIDEGLMDGRTDGRAQNRVLRDLRLLAVGAFLGQVNMPKHMIEKMVLLWLCIRQF